ncbi:hypothetical protein COAQ111491_20505 [Comamonas aquatilis]
MRCWSPTGIFFGVPCLRACTSEFKIISFGPWRKKLRHRFRLLFKSARPCHQLVKLSIHTSRPNCPVHRQRRRPLGLAYLTHGPPPWSGWRAAPARAWFGVERRVRARSAQSLGRKSRRVTAPLVRRSISGQCSIGVLRPSCFHCQTAALVTPSQSANAFSEPAISAAFSIGCFIPLRLAFLVFRGKYY